MSVIATGVLASANDALTINPGAVEGVLFGLSGTWTGTVTFEGDPNGGGTYVSIYAVKSSDGTKSATTTGNGAFYVPQSGYQSIRARFSTASSGSINASVSRAYAPAVV